MSALVEVVQVGSEYQLKTSNGLVIRSSNKNISVEKNGTVKATFAYSSGSVEIACGSANYKLQYNKSGGMFRFYSTSQQAVTMYRLS